MKKIVTAVLALAMLASLLVGCGSNAPAETTVETTTEVTTEATAAETTEAVETTESAVEETTEAAVVEGPSADALAILENIWADYAEDEKFPIGGGDSENFTMNTPGAVDMTKAENLTYTLLVPVEDMANMDGAATMMHMMNTNTFASGLFHMVEGTDMIDLAARMKDIIKNNPFVCGFPERMLLAVVEGEYLLVSFGNGEIMDNFQNHLTAVYPETEILHTDSIM